MLRVRDAALILAALFLNYPFWLVNGANLYVACSPVLWVAILAVATVAMVAGTFLGPALAS